MRVIAGKAKGRNLTAPKGLRTRPVPAMIKEALYNIWQSRIDGARFLDLFAGAGGLSEGFIQDEKIKLPYRSLLLKDVYEPGWRDYRTVVFHSPYKGLSSYQGA